MNSASGPVGKEQQHAKYLVSSRKIVAVGTDVHVKEFVLAAGEEIPWHRHTQMFDVFYCLDGRLEIDLVEPEQGRRMPTLALNPSESAKVDAGTPHRPHNRGPGPCRFLLVQGIGTYDYIPYRPAQSQEAK